MLGGAVSELTVCSYKIPNPLPAVDNVKVLLKDYTHLHTHTYKCTALAALRIISK